MTQLAYICTMQKNSSKKPASSSKGNIVSADAKTIALSYSGRLPPPAMLAEFDRVVENGAERIIRMAEKDQEMTYKLEQRRLKFFARGQLFGFTIAAIGIVLGTALAYFEKAEVAVALFTFTLAPSIAAMLGEYFRKK